MFTKIPALVVQILLVIAAVVVFSFFDPFGLLAPKKKTLQDTPVSVISIKEIGQLITAEYYGEVLSSLQGELIEEVVVSKEKYGNKVDTLNLKYLQALKLFYVNKDSIKVRWLRKKEDLTNYFYAANPSLINEPFYQDMIKSVLVKCGDDSEGELLKGIWKEKSNLTALDLNKVLDRFRINRAQAENLKQQEIVKLTGSKSFKKRQIIALGRGWVRAGIDFKNFNERNFKYDKADKTIYLFGLEPEILSSDINPWFNAKEKIKGFEIIAATNKANDPGYLGIVKESCLNKLIRQALEAGIIQQAKVNAEETLKNFFSLLIDEPLDKVVIMKNSLAEYQASLLARPVLTIDRLPLIDSVLVYLDNVDSATAVETVIKLNEKKFKIDRDTFPLTRYSALAYRIAEDKLITTQEWSELNKAMKSNILTRLDSIWFFPYKEYKSITNSVTAQAREQSKYEATGLRYWADSVRSKASYILFKKTTDSLKMQQLKKVMATNRIRAIDASIDLMKRYVNTIRAEQTEMNDAVKVTGMFNELKN